MASFEKKADAVQSSIASSTATTTTVEIAKSLLAQTPTSLGNAQYNVRASGTSASAGTRKCVPKPSEDCPQTASSSALQKQRYSFATELCNSTLKALGDLVKSHVRASATQSTVPDCRGKPVETDALTSTRSSPPLREALKSRSHNIGTQSKAPRSKAFDGLQSQKDSGEVAVLATAQCARLALDYLRTNQRHVREGSNSAETQLSDASFALASYLAKLGQATLAFEELRSLQLFLWPSAGSKNNAAQSSVKSTSRGTSQQQVSDLLDFVIGLDAPVEELQLAIRFQLLCVKLIVSIGTPSMLDNALLHICTSKLSSPASLMQRQARIPDLRERSIQQLQSMSQLLIGYMPRATSNADAASSSSKGRACTECRFQIHTLGLEMRKIWWELANHHVDYEKELIHPFNKSMLTFCRGSRDETSTTYEVAKRSYELISAGVPTTISGWFDTFKVLCVLAQSRSTVSDSTHWLKCMLNDSKKLPRNHARNIFCGFRALSIRTTMPYDFEVQPASTNDLRTISEALKEKITGTASDFETLLIEIAQIVKSLSIAYPSCTDLNACRSVFMLAGAFAQRYSRTCKGGHALLIRGILTVAIDHSHTTAEVTSWVTADALQAFGSSDFVQEMASAASNSSSDLCWSSSTAAIILDRILNGLTARSLLAGTCLSSEMRQAFLNAPVAFMGVILERCLHWAESLVTQSKYRRNIGKIMLTLSHDLSGTYTSQQYPMRRVRTYISLRRLSQMMDSSSKKEMLSDWQDGISLDGNELGEDYGLSSYTIDVMTSLRLTEAFDSNRPSLNTLQECLAAWKSLNLGQHCSKPGDQQVENHERLRKQLSALADYAFALGEESLHLTTLQLLDRLLPDLHHSRVDVLVAIADHHISSFDSSQASSAIADVVRLASVHDATAISKLRVSLVRSTYLDTIGEHEEAKTILESSMTLFGQTSRESTTKHERRELHAIAAHVWHIFSNIQFHLGLPHEAIAASKYSIKIYNSIWSAYDVCSCRQAQSAQDESAPPDEGIASELTVAMKGLQLTGRGESCRCKTGPSYWSLIPSMSAAFLNASYLHAHHGVFQEANYYLEQALRVVEPFGSCPRLVALRIHKARLLLRAQRIEDAELCIATLDHQRIKDHRLLQIGLTLVEAGIHLAEGSLVEALAKVDNLDNEIRHGQTSGERSTDTADELIKDALPGKTARKAKTSSTRSKSASTNAVSKSMSRPRAGLARNESLHSGASPKSLMHGDLISLRLLKVSLLMRLGKDPTAALKELITQTMTPIDRLQCETLSFHALMQEAKHIIRGDVSLNVLLESTLAMPTFRTQGTARSKTAPSTSVRADSRRSAKSKVPQSNAALLDVLSAAKETLLKSQQTRRVHSSTSLAHQEPHMCGEVAFLATAMASSQVSTDMMTESAQLENARSRAVTFQRRATRFEKSAAIALEWPTFSPDRGQENKDTPTFQSEYLDILPPSWVAVSLTLSEDANELYLARYQNGMSPFLMKLPFDRHKPALGDDIDEDALFTFQAAKDELEDVIAKSNLSCHSTNDMNGKGARNKWWTERQDLDRRLHQLIRNMQGSWLGGFRALLSTSRSGASALAIFEKTLGEILRRHLPSRMKSRSHQAECVWQAHVLQLFINLGTEANAMDDLEESLADLLYFIVDSLQFEGEHNAYDEIDFDSMTMEVADAVRSSCVNLPSDSPEDDQHLVLVLDRRLQVFPWENMPCLEHLSVSRIDSMLSLRQCILAMRSAQHEHQNAGIHTVSRHTGTSILNPSSDLAATQTVLQPALAGIEKEHGSQWTSLVKEVPSEAYFKDRLADSTILLYFGHGAGSQYIRPRTIKRLDACSEVVWLMGCSSGSVTEHGDFEPESVPLSYLAAGANTTRLDTVEEDNTSSQQPRAGKCMAVLATLWDVTDKDIDRFSLATGERWGLWLPSNDLHLLQRPVKERVQVVDLLTPVKAPKTPKTPKHKPKSVQGSHATTGHVTRESHPRDGSMCLSEAVSRARDSCYLRYLNGAAPVVYGIPVYLQQRS